MIIEEAYTFDDVLLQPAHTSFGPADAKVSTFISKDIKLNIPLISAAMDTVTEHRLAITMAQLGGIEVLHKNFSIKEQASEVKKVKKFEAGMVVDPVTIRPDQTLGEAFKLMEKHKISGIPVVEGTQSKLVGILINKDVRFANDSNQPVSALMTRNVITVKENVSAEEAKKLLHTNRIEKLIVVDEDNFCVGLIIVKDMEKAQNHLEACKDNHGRLRVAAATGVGKDGMARAEALIEAGVPQLKAISDCSKVTRKASIQIIADGGIKYSGDIAKAIAGGARAVMVGSLLAGTDETPGEVFLFQGRSYKSYRGMGSLGAMARGSADRYFQAEIETLKLVPEGIEGQVPYKGPSENVIHQLVGGLKSAMGYTGNKNIKEMQKNCVFKRISNAGLRESHVHDVTITREAPNYRSS